MTSFVDGDRRELEKKAKAEGRLPPGQSLTLKWPVLHYGSVPHFDVAKWDFKISGLVEERAVGARVPAPRTGSAGFLGAQWVSRVRRSVERAALFRKLKNGV